MILMLPFLLITLHFSQIGFTEDLTFMMNPPFFAPSAPCRGIFCCKLLECVFFLWVRKKSTRKSSFYSIAFCSRKCKKFFTYFFIFFCSFSVHFFISPTGSHDHPLSGWHVLPLEGDITCLRPEGALKSANCTTFTAAPKLGAFSVLPYSGAASKEACWFALTSYFRSKRDLLIVFLHRLTRERVDILY